jgi:hypothetical protein
MLLSGQSVLQKQFTAESRGSEKHILKGKRVQTGGTGKNAYDGPL